MSEAPSWLTEENISTATKVANNPAAQKAAKSPAVQAAAKSAVKAQLNKEAPGWTSDDINNDVEKGRTAPPPPPKPVASTKSQPHHPPINTDMSDVDEPTMKAMQNYHLALRVLYMGAAVFLSAAAALALQNQQDLGLIFFSFYVFFFSAMICCFECALTAIARLIAVNFGFMYSAAGRFLFIVLVGFMAFLLSTIGKVAMGFLYAVMLFHIYVLFKFPRFEEYLRKKHYFEGRQAEQAAKRGK